MLEMIEKLLVLQDRDQKIHRVQQELAHIIPERETLRAKASTTQAQFEATKTRVKQPLSYGFDVYQTLFDFGKSLSGYKASRETLKAREANIESVKRLAQIV